MILCSAETNEAITVSNGPSNATLSYRFSLRINLENAFFLRPTKYEELEETSISLKFLALDDNKSFRIEFCREYSINQELSQYERKNLKSIFYERKIENNVQ